MMLAAVSIPALDPVGLPAPPALFVFLQLLTVLLHLLFMNFVLGGSVLALGLNVAALAGRREAHPIANLIHQAMPPMISMAVTMGVAPLLFVQVLYGPFFYSANVLLGFAWFSFVVVLLVGFYLTYWLTYRGSNALQRRTGAWDDKPLRRLAVGVLTTAGFLWIAWVLTNNHEMSIHPNLWADGDAWRSPRWFVPSATTIPRFLHNVVGATAIAGLWLAAIGWWRVRRGTGEPEAQFGMIRLGLIVAAVLSTIQVIVGLYFLLSLDRGVMWELLGFRTFLGGIWSVTLLIALLLPLGMGYAAKHVRRFSWFAMSAGAGVLVTAGMLCGHEQVRTSSLARIEPEGFALDQWTVYPQWTNVVLFALVLVGGLALVGLMLYWITDRTATETAGSTD